MRKSYLMRRPDDDDQDYYTGGNNLIHAKPIDERYAKSLGDAYKGKDFVRGSQSSQQHFYATSSASSNSDIMRPLTHDERNKISAKIIKAEMKQNKDLVRKLREKLECGMVEINPTETSSSTTSKPDDYVLLMKMDKKSGLVMPAEKESSTPESSSKSGKRGIGTVEQEYSQQMYLKDMVSKERSITSLDQMTMFGRADKVTAGHDEEEDWGVNDTIISNPKKRRTQEKDQCKHESTRIREALASLA
uniref:Uncharacterized protein n=1 Tax=Ditylenchus dipsaci TaxID=166011 RepID=A0A915ES91_9BILA